MNRLCPACAGLVGPAAEWCGLCFADLRASAPAVAAGQPGAASEPTPGIPSAPAGQPAPAVTASHPEVPAAPETVGPPALVVLPLVDPPAPVGAVQPGWPCSVCSSVVPYEADACPICGAGFLSALTGSGVPRLPIVGTPVATGRRGTWVLGAVVLVGLALLLLLALVLAGRAAG